MSASQNNRVHIYGGYNRKFDPIFTAVELRRGVDYHDCMFGHPYREPVDVAKVCQLVPHNATHTKVDLFDIAVRVSFLDGAGLEASVDVTFKADECPWPFDTYVEVPNNSSVNPHSLRSGRDKYFTFLRVSAEQKFAQLTDELTVPWHRIVKFEVVKTLQKSSGTVIWKWNYTNRG